MHVDTLFLVIASVYVMTMTFPGLILYYAADAAARNYVQLNVTVAWFAGFAAWMLFGHYLAFDLDAVGVSGNVDPLAFKLFQGVFAGTATAILAGVVPGLSMAETVFRSFFWIFTVYLVVADSTWSSSGIFHRLGVLDFAGGLVVHITTGFTAWAMRNQTMTGGKPNTSLRSMGGSAIVIGWLWFNGGSALAPDHHALVAVVNTLIAGTVGALVYPLITAEEHAEAEHAIDGIIAALVAITPACAYVTPTSAATIGLLASVFCGLAMRLRLGDAAGVFPIHGVGGVVGAISTGVFATRVVYGGEEPLGLVDWNLELLAVQVFATFLVAAGATVGGALLNVIGNYFPRVS